MTFRCIIAFALVAYHAYYNTIFANFVHLSTERTFSRHCIFSSVLCCDEEWRCDHSHCLCFLVVFTANLAFKSVLRQSCNLMWSYFYKQKRVSSYSCLHVLNLHVHLILVRVICINFHGMLLISAHPYTILRLSLLSFTWLPCAFSTNTIR